MRHFWHAAGLIAAAASWLPETARAEECKVAKYGTLPVEMAGLRATTHVGINGRDTRFILDTGAFFNTMPRATAEALALKREPAPPGFYLTGIGGSASVELTRVKDFGILGTTMHDVAFLVGGSDAGAGLLGANLLNFADAEADLAHGQYTLFKTTGCGKRALAYWAQDGNYRVADLIAGESRLDRTPTLYVTVNGHRVKAALDSGAVSTLITRRAAERAGIDLTAPDVQASYAAHGIGTKSYRSWTVRVAAYSIGTETIQHAQMQVMDGDMGSSANAPEMLLGIDFFLAHRMFIANSQRKLYFTYNGGRVFSLSKAPTGSDKPAADGADTAGGPKTAADYALRGRASLSRGEPAKALTDLDAAIRLDPDKPDYYLARAQAHMHERQREQALADLDRALALAPRDIEALLLRARINFRRKDQAAALRDVDAANGIATPGSPQARQVATAYIALDQPDRALPLLDAWIRLHRDDGTLGNALNERCWARGLAGQMLDGALDDCRKAIRRDGPKPGYLDSLGLVQLRLGHYAEAVDAYGKAAQQLSSNPWTRYGLGLARLRSGDTAGGNADIAAAKALDKDIAEQFAKFGIEAM
ncbi:tetratricopeptide repeat protein [Sphingomonas sp. CL5.1]|uniref:retroviral-like aspartic protease family protein n=1 Tax=Sphingomonas sp. CL5.1 TaxID=2653203 RepID=UPI001581E01D|nr:retroviral-like aspartic protease family protein [Sphingomonas sp. CL5.1]QKR99048.1 tetratricopeptide repeat protein [Sphingomonas sp. CL5.1]